MLFLYFPDDPAVYIPAAISLSIFVLFSILAFIWIKKYSKKEELRTKKLEEKLRFENHDHGEQ